MRILLFVFWLASGNTIIAQDCNYYFLKNNKTIEQSFKNKKGKESGKQVYIISNVSKTGNTTTGTANSEFFSDKGKSISKATNNIKCAGGILMMDMKLFIPSAQQEQMGAAAATASDVYLEYPVEMKDGDALKDGQFSMDYKNASGMAGNVSISITERKVLGKENVTTPAGTWDCIKISSNQKIIIKIAGIGIPVKADVIEWFAPGFGVVKTDANGATTEITSIK
jgi:hypothetical protein